MPACRISDIKALTPEGIEFVLSPAGLPVRTIAYAIDKIIQYSILLAIYILFSFFRFALGIWIFFILSFCVDWFYHVIFELAFKGQSPGKRFMGIRTIRSDGAPVDPASSFLRNLLRFADTFFFLFHIAFISIASSRGFRRIGDWAGGTLVVYSSIAKNTPRNSLNRFLEKYEPCAASGSISQDEKLAILDFARRYPLLGEARANEIAAIYIPHLKNGNTSLNNLSGAAYLLGIARKLSGG
ncbi:MAG: RDD family protein [Treponema sp.]|nr:RDD family protein [Treponema sp.]